MFPSLRDKLSLERHSLLAHSFLLNNTGAMFLGIVSTASPSHQVMPSLQAEEMSLLGLLQVNVMIHST